MVAEPDLDLPLDAEEYVVGEVVIVEPHWVGGDTIQPEHGQ